MAKTSTKSQLLVERPAKQILRDGDQVIKLFELKTYAAADVLNEAHNLACVNETALNTPKFIEVAPREHGKLALVMEYIKGETLADKMKKEPKKLGAYLERFVDIQLEIHKYSIPRLPRLRNKMHSKISASGLEATNRYELHTRLDGLPRHAKLCHGDFNPTNVIITDNDEAYIIDWSHATQGNGSADAARTYLVFLLSGKADVAEKYLNLYCQKSDTAKQYVQKWLAIVAASQLVKNKPAEREILSRWANVVEYE
jgi:aminoglycoside phosphotransferase (APT) family kinase protein